MAEQPGAPRQTHPQLDLATFPPPLIPGNRGFATRALWYLVSAVCFSHALALLPSTAKAELLRWFGATVGPGLVIKPRVTIKYPWFLRVGRSVWIGERAWIDNPAPVALGDNVCVSQGATLISGNHDFKRADFAYFGGPITVGDRVWVCAGAIVAPGSTIPAGTVVAIGSVWRGDAA